MHNTHCQPAMLAAPRLLPGASDDYSYLTGFLEGLAATGRFDALGADALLVRSDSAQAEEIEADLAAIRREILAVMRRPDPLQDLINARLARFDHNDIRARNSRFIGFRAGMTSAPAAPQPVREIMTHLA